MTKSSGIRKRIDSYELIYPLIIGVFLVVSGQAQYGFVEHDDFDFLLRPTEILVYATPFQRTLSEGRWINYLWSFLSPNLTPVWCSLVFISVYRLSWSK